MPADYHPSKKGYRYQTPGQLNQANPTQNLFYPVLDELNCRVYALNIAVATANETLECRVTIDGVVVPAAALAAAFGINYVGYRFMDGTARTVNIGFATTTEANQLRGPAFLFEGDHVLIELRKTTALGVGALTAVAPWGQL